MAESVTNSAAYLQALLQPNRQQPNGISNADSQQFSLQLAAEVSRQDAAAAATEVPAATDDRANLQNYSGSSSDPQFTLPTQPQPAPEVTLPAPPSGPSKAQVSLPIFQLAQSTDGSASAANAGSVGAPPQPAPAQSASQNTPPGQTQQQTVAGALGPAEELNPLSLENITETIIGVAFAPMQVSQTPPQGGGGGFGRQKDFIFSGHQVFGINYEPAPAPATSPSTQPVSLDPAPAPTPAVAPGSGSTNVGSGTAAYSTASAPAVAPATGQGDSRQTLYERAQAIANALGAKSANPQVQQLFSDLASYKAWMQTETPGTSTPAATHSVTITA